MSRTLKSWSNDSRPRKGPKITLFRDLATMWRRNQAVPHAAPPREGSSRARLGWSNVKAIKLSALLVPRVNLEVVGRDSLVGLETPIIFAANQAGPWDQRILTAALPPALRPTGRRLSQLLSRRRNVAVFADEPQGGRLVGEFDTTAAELAKQHGVMVLPVGIVGTYRLADTLQLSLKQKPTVSVRFGPPLHPRGRGIDEITRDVQAHVEALVNEGELSWWEVEQRHSGNPVEAPSGISRWRRLWQQAAPKGGRTRERIWR